MPVVKEAIRTKQLPIDLPHDRYLDYRVILSHSKFNWSQIAKIVGKTPEECFF